MALPTEKNKLLDSVENKTTEITTKAKSDKVCVKLLRETRYNGEVYKAWATLTIDKSELKHFVGLISDDVQACENCK